jgi:hypothetical protein
VGWGGVGGRQGGLGGDGGSRGGDLGGGGGGVGGGPEGGKGGRGGERASLSRGQRAPVAAGGMGLGLSQSPGSHTLSSSQGDLA